MEIMGAHIGAGDFEGSNSICFHVNDSILILQRTFDPEKPAARNDNAITLKGIRSNDDIGDAGLIFEGKKDEPFRSAWPLACDDTPSNAHKAVTRGVTQVLC